MPSRLLMLLLLCAATSVAQVSAPAAGAAQQSPAATPRQQSSAPQVRVNMINVCTPSEADQQEIKAALAKLPLRPAFGIDMEIARGRSTANPSDLPIETGGTQTGPAPVSNWVRIRHEFGDSSPLLNAQYAFSASGKRVSETLVWRFRDPKTVMQVSLSDTVDAVSDPAQVARLDNPVSRIRIERFGKSSLVLARCAEADQTTYESLFRKATELMSSYRNAVQVKSVVPAELGRLGSSSNVKGKSGNSRH